MIKQRLITVHTSFEGFHRYADAPDEVSYLRDVHRHIFNVSVQMEVFHADRELEFIMVKHQLDKFISCLPVRVKENAAKMSCEMIAERIIEYLTVSYGSTRSINVSVDEDGENGSVVVWEGEN